MHLSNSRPSLSSSADSGRSQSACDDFANMGRKNKNKKTSTWTSTSGAGEVQPARSEKENSGAASLAIKSDETVSSQSGSSTVSPDEPVPDGVAQSPRTDTCHDEHSSTPAPAVRTLGDTKVDTDFGISPHTKDPGNEAYNGETQSDVARSEPRTRESLAVSVPHGDSTAEKAPAQVRSFCASFSKQSVLN